MTLSFTPAIHGTDRLGDELTRDAIERLLLPYLSAETIADLCRYGMSDHLSQTEIVRAREACRYHSQLVTLSDRPTVTTREGDVWTARYVEDGHWVSNSSGPGGAEMLQSEVDVPAAVREAIGG